MMRDILGILKREFSWFEFRVNELERLKGILYSLDTRSFENDFDVIKRRLSDIGNKAEVERLIHDLKLRIREKRINSISRVAELIDSIFEYNEGMGLWSYEKIREEYMRILKRYEELPEEEKLFVYNIIDRLYKKIREKNEG